MRECCWRGELGSSDWKKGEYKVPEGWEWVMAGATTGYEKGFTPEYASDCREHCKAGLRLVLFSPTVNVVRTPSI